MAIDPVCGMTVDETSAACAHVHEGETCYFCSPHCRAKFETDPAGYLKRTETLPPLKHTNHILSSLLIIAGLILLSASWKVLYEARGRDLVTQ